MLRNYLLVAYRTLRRNKTYSWINILGLSMGMTTCFLIALFVRDELKYDAFHENKDKVFRIYDFREGDDDQYSIALTPSPFGTEIPKNIPEVELSLRMMPYFQESLIEMGDDRFLESGGIFAEPTFFEMFSFNLKLGDMSSALNDPFSVVLEKEFAYRLFADSDPLGRTIKISGSEFTVTGVIHIPEHSHLQNKFIVSFATLEKWIASERFANWNWQQFYNYIKLEDNVDWQMAELKIQDYIRDVAHPVTQSSGFIYTPHLQKVDDIYLNSTNLRWDYIKKGNGSHIKIFVLVGIGIMFIAVFNFINMATARSIKRSKEVMVRKVNGAHKRELMFQFLGESIIYSTIAMLIAGLATEILIPVLNNFTGKSLDIQLWSDPSVIFILLAFTLLISLLAGLYPSIIISNRNPAITLKSFSGTGSSFTFLRKTLVVLQFLISAVLIIGAFVVFGQLEYMSNKDLGFARDQIIELPMRSPSMKNYKNAKTVFNNIPGVISSSSCYGVPGSIVAGDGIIIPETQTEFPLNVFAIDHDYVTTLGLHLTAGRGFDKNRTTDISESFLVNETAAKDIGYDPPSKAIGESIHWQRWGEDSIKKGRIIGVVQDFHFRSLHQKVEPAVLHIYPQVFSSMLIRISTSNVSQTLEAIEEKYNVLSPEWPFTYTFIDSRFGEMYSKEKNMSTLIGIFSVIAVVIAAMGLIGLVSFIAEKRKREIGIRKVFGASSINMLQLMLKDFSRVILISFIAGVPFAWYLLNQWLQEFAYHITLHWWYFASVFVLLLVLSWITIGYQSIKVSVTNPIDVLKDE